MSGNGGGLAGINTSVPNVARIYDYVLGGKDNISQAVLTIRYSDPTATIQERQTQLARVRQGLLDL